MLSIKKFKKIKKLYPNNANGFCRSEELIKELLPLNELKVSDVYTLDSSYDIIQREKAEIAKEYRLSEEDSLDINIIISADYDDFASNLKLCYIECENGDKILVPAVYDTKEKNFLSLPDIMNKLYNYSCIVHFPTEIKHTKEYHTELDRNETEDIYERTSYKQEIWDLDNIVKWSDWNIPYIEKIREEENIR